MICNSAGHMVIIMDMTHVLWIVGNDYHMVFHLSFVSHIGPMKVTMSQAMWIPHGKNDCIIVHNNYDAVCAMSCPLWLCVLFDLSIIIMGPLIVFVLCN
jgi:hypothetical protein